MIANHMYIPRFFVAVLLLRFSAMLDAAPRPDLTQTPVPAAREMASKAKTGKTAHEFCDAALASGRYEIVELCWEYPYTESFLWDAMLKMPVESKERDALIVMMMRHPRTSWLDPHSLTHGGPDGVYARGAAENVIPLLRKYLPDLVVKFSVIDTREKRLAIAEKYAKAAGLPIEDSTDAKRVWPPQSVGNGVPARKEDKGRNATPSASAVVIMPSDAATSLPGGWALWAGIAAVLAAVAGWLLFRSKGKGKG